ncbi:ribonuclease H-like domain-containing protein [Tanacetum coccineum]|uniref:Ribonuclease H-like domain-containing protein n=1 Tax=Tanacetum coccineum TaxID=301880 RepID=A0ABQ5D1Q4_9ASTR
MDTGASSYLAENTGMLTSFSNPSLYKSVFVGNGQPIPVTHTGHSHLHTPHKPLHLHHVLVTPNIIKNLISVRQFTRDNNVSVDFDAYGFSIKDYQTRRLLLRCDSTGDLYPVTQQPSSTTTFALLSLNPTTWHRRLGHPSEDLDVKNAFLHGQLSETVYMHQPPGFVDSAHPDYVCHLQRSLYGLKQAPQAWFQRFASLITRVGFQHSKTDTSLFVYHRGSDVVYLLLYVDGIILTASSTALLQRIITLLHSEFAMTDLGSLNYFLGISTQRSNSGLFLCQSKFAEEILERAHMQHCNPCKTLVDTKFKLGSDGDPICLYMHDPRDPHFTALKRILRYVRGTIDHGLQLHVSFTSQLTTYIDADWADWAGCPVTRRSTSRYCVFLGDNLLSWSAKQHLTLSRSSVEAEYQEYLASGQVRVLHVPSRFQYADIFTKGLPTALFLEFRSSLNVRRPLAPTAGEY